jgi:PAS domain S-box-containing protein
MPKLLRVLILEDSKTDEQLLLRELKGNGYYAEHICVQTAADMRDALDQKPWDIILSDYSMPGFDALEALMIVRQERKLSLPFIIISGTVGEDTAVQAMRAGANDFFAKDKLNRLIPVIERELREIKNRQMREQAENRFAKIFHASPVSIVISRLSDGRVTDLNQHFVQTFGYKREDLIGKSGVELELWTEPKQREEILEILKIESMVKDFEVHVRSASGKEAYVLLSAEIIELDDEPSILTMLQDITHRKQVEQNLEQYANRLKLLHAIDKAILQSEKPALIAQAVLAQMISIFAYHSASISIFDLKRQEYTVLATTEDQNPVLSAGTIAPIEDIRIIKHLQANKIYRHTDLSELSSATGTHGLRIKAGIHSYICIPLIANNILLGSINFCSEQVDTFAKEELEIAREIAAQLAIVLENSRLLETEQMQNVQLTALQQASLELTSSVEVETILDIILDYAIVLVNANDAHIFLYDGETLHFGAAYWDEKKQAQAIAQPRKDGLSYTVARSNQEMVIPDVNQHPIYQDWQWGGAIIALPLRVAGTVNGVMSLAYRSPHNFEAHEIRILELLADQAAIAIHNAQQHQEIQRYAAQLELRVAERTTELEAAMDHSNAILRSSRDALVLLKPHGLISELNPAFCEIFNCDADAILGQRLTEVLEMEQVEQFEQALQLAMHERSVQRIDLTIRHKDGAMLDMDLLLSPIDTDSDKEQELICSLRDMSLRKQIEIDLRQALEKEKELNEMKSSFTSMISHEFRTPLAIIQSTADVILNYYDRIDESTKKKRLLKIGEQVKRLTQLMDDVLFVGRAEQTGLKFEPKPINLGELCESMIEDLRASYDDEEKSLQFRIEGDCQQRYLDKDLFRHIFQNLLSNAFKYSAPNSKIEIRLLCNAIDTVLLVRDEGIGIPEGYQKNLFKTFHRAQNVGTIQGTGLGLAIVKRAVDQHGGTIHVKSIEGEGTLFVVKLPNKP